VTADTEFVCNGLQN